MRRCEQKSSHCSATMQGLSSKRPRRRSRSPKSRRPAGRRWCIVSSAVPDPGAPWRWRHGGSVPRARQQAGARGRDQDPAAAFHLGSRAPRALRAGGAHARLAQPRAHRRDLRTGRLRWRDGAGPRTRRRTDAGRPPGARAAPGDQGAGDRPSGCRGSRCGAREGIVHRDLKPSNIVLQGDTAVTSGAVRAKVLDFGLAKPIAEAAEGDATATVNDTADGRILGTPAYMSPEQARGLPVDKRTDIWAFRCVLYELLTGVRAFRGHSTSELMVAILTLQPDLSRLPGTVPPRVVDLLQRCLMKDPRGAPARHRGRAKRFKRSQRAAARLVVFAAEVQVRLAARSDGGYRRCGDRPCRVGHRRLRIVAALQHQDRVGQSARGRAVHAGHQLPRNRNASRDFAGWKVRGIPIRPRWADESDADPGGDRTGHRI